MQEFKIDKKYITITKTCFLGILFFFILGLSLPFLPDEEKGNAHGTIILALISTVVIGCGLILTWLTLRELPYADIVTDADGIWYMHVGRNKGLIPWEKISLVTASTYLRFIKMQGLDLLDSSGKRLLKVHYHLNGFEELRSTLNEKILNNMESTPLKFSKSLFYHFYYLSFMLGFAASGLYLALEGMPLFGFLGAILSSSCLILEYARTIVGLIVGNGRLEICYPFTRISISFFDIEYIQIVDTFFLGDRTPEVWVMSKHMQEPVKLKQVGADLNAVYIALRKAVNI